MKRGKKGTRLLSMFFVFVFFISQIGNLKVLAEEKLGESTEYLSLTQSIDNPPSNNEYKLYENIDVNFNINVGNELQKINKKEYDNVSKKEVVLVVDKSQSMGTTFSGEEANNLEVKKVGQVQKSVTKFVNKFSDEIYNAKVGLVISTNKAFVSSELLDNEDEIKNLQNKVSTTCSSTSNMGDGLRKAYTMLKKGDKDAEKYIVVMTDGGNNSYSLKQSQDEYLLDDYGYTSDNEKYDVYKDEYNNAKNSTEYAKKIMSKNKDMKVHTFMLGFTEEEENISKLKELISGFDDIKMKQIVYKSADKDVNDIYYEIEDSMKSREIKNIKIKCTFPNGLEIQKICDMEGKTIDCSVDKNEDGSSTINRVINNIKYIENEEEYILDPLELKKFNFSVSLKGSKEGEYELKDASITYKDAYNNKVEEVSNSQRIKVIDDELNDSLKLTQKLKDPPKDNNYKLEDEVNIEYSIGPLDGINKRKYDELNKENKEIVLVVDTSQSMKWNLEGVKQTNPNDSMRIRKVKYALSKFLETIQEDSKFNYSMGLVLYDNYARTITDLGKKDISKNVSCMSESWCSGRTNIGDGLRKAYNMLENGDDDAEKYIVLVTDGEPEGYSVQKGRGYDYYYDPDYSKDKFYYFGDSDDYNKDFMPPHYMSYGMSDKEKEEIQKKNEKVDEEEKIRGIEYAKEIMNLNKDKNVNTFMVAFTEDAKMESLNKIIEGCDKVKLIQALTEDDINKVYSDIADTIKSPSIKNIQYKLKLPKGLEVQEVTDGAGKNLEGFKVEKEKDGSSNLIGNIDDISYIKTEINSRGREEYVVDESQLDKLKLNVKLKVKERGNYVLGLKEDGNEEESKGAFITYTDINHKESKKWFEPPISILSEDIDKVVIEKFGLFKNTSREQNVEDYLQNKNVSIFNNCCYTLGSILKIECDESQSGNPVEKEINIKINNNLMDTKENSINNNGNRNVKLYSFQENKLGEKEIKLTKSWSNIEKQEIIIPANTIKKGQKYILVQDFIPNCTLNDSKISCKLTNSIIANEFDPITKELGITLFNSLPNLE